MVYRFNELFKLVDELRYECSVTRTHRVNRRSTHVEIWIHSATAQAGYETQMQFSGYYPEAMRWLRKRKREVLGNE